MQARDKGYYKKIESKINNLLIAFKLTEQTIKESLDSINKDKREQEATFKVEYKNKKQSFENVQQAYNRQNSTILNYQEKFVELNTQLNNIRNTFNETKSEIEKNLSSSKSKLIDLKKAYQEETEKFQSELMVIENIAKVTKEQLNSRTDVFDQQLKNIQHDEECLTALQALTAYIDNAFINIKQSSKIHNKIIGDFKNQNEIILRLNQSIINKNEIDIKLNQTENLLNMRINKTLVEDDNNISNNNEFRDKDDYSIVVKNFELAFAQLDSSLQCLKQLANNTTRLKLSGIYSFSSVINEIRRNFNSQAEKINQFKNKHTAMEQFEKFNKEVTSSIIKIKTINNNTEEFKIDSIDPKDIANYKTRLERFEDKKLVFNDDISDLKKKSSIPRELWTKELKNLFNNKYGQVIEALNLEFANYETKIINYKQQYEFYKIVASGEIINGIKTILDWNRLFGIFEKSYTISSLININKLLEKTIELKKKAITTKTEYNECQDKIIQYLDTYLDKNKVFDNDSYREILNLLSKLNKINNIKTFLTQSTKDKLNFYITQNAWDKIEIADQKALQTFIKDIETCHFAGLDVNKQLARITNDKHAKDLSSIENISALLAISNACNDKTCIELTSHGLRQLFYKVIDIAEYTNDTTQFAKISQILHTFDQCINLGFVTNNPESLEFIKLCLDKISLLFTNELSNSKDNAKLIRGNIDLSKIINHLKKLLDNYNDVNQNRNVISILSSLHDLGISESEINKKIATLYKTQDFRIDNTFVNDLLIFAQMGINIKPFVDNLILPRNVDFRHILQLAKLLKACVIHDANSHDPKAKIDFGIIDECFNRIDWFYQNHTTADAQRQTQCAPQNERFKSGQLRATEEAYSIVEAAAFYGKTQIPYLQEILRLNKAYTISPQQQRLYDILREEFRDIRFKITLEDDQGTTSILNGTYSADILLTDTHKKIAYDIEYDGRGSHHYNNFKLEADRTRSIREDQARDSNMNQRNILCVRVTYEDIYEYQNDKRLGFKISQRSLITKFILNILPDKINRPAQTNYNLPLLPTESTFTARPTAPTSNGSTTSHNNHSSGRGRGLPMTQGTSNNSNRLFTNNSSKPSNRPNNGSHIGPKNGPRGNKFNNK